MTDLVQVLEEATRDSRSDFGPPTSWRFSGLGKCLRAQVLGRLGVGGAPFSDQTLSIFRMGDLLETDTLKLLGTKVVVITRDVNGNQVKVRVPEYDASGSLDALAVVDGELVVLEVKSTRDSALSYGDLPYRTHALQAGAYALFLGLQTAYVIYIGRDGAKKVCRVRASDVEQDVKKEWAELNFWWNRIQDALMTSRAEDFEGALPPKKKQVQATKKVKGVKVPFVYEIDGPWGKKGDAKYELDNECLRCPYLKQCWGETGELGDRPEEGATAKRADTSTPPADREAAESVGAV